MEGDQIDARLGDAGFLRGDLLEPVAEKGGVVEAELGDAADGRGADDVGRVEPPAETDLDDAGVGRRARESEEGGRGGRLEEADLHPVGQIERLLEQGGERVVVDQPAGEADPLVEADEMGAGIDMGGEPGCLDRGAQEGAGRTLAVGAGDMEHRRQRVLRIAEPVEQGGDPLEPENVAAGRQAGEPVELGLDARVGGRGVVH